MGEGRQEAGGNEKTAGAGEGGHTRHCVSVCVLSERQSPID